MSSKIDKLSTKKFKSFGQAISKYLEIIDMTQTELVERIIEADQKFRSLQQMMSRWMTGGNISRHYREKICKELDVNAYKDVDGQWMIKEYDRKKESSSATKAILTDEPEVQYADQVELPESGTLSRDQMKSFLGQIESIARILKDSL